MSLRNEEDAEGGGDGPSIAEAMQAAQAEAPVTAPADAAPADAAPVAAATAAVVSAPVAAAAATAAPAVQAPTPTPAPVVKAPAPAAKVPTPAPVAKAPVAKAPAPAPAAKVPAPAPAAKVPAPAPAPVVQAPAPVVQAPAPAPAPIPAPAPVPAPATPRPGTFVPNPLLSNYRPSEPSSTYSRPSVGLVPRSARVKPTIDGARGQLDEKMDLLRVKTPPQAVSKIYDQYKQRAVNDYRDNLKRR